LTLEVSVGNVSYLEWLMKENEIRPLPRRGCGGSKITGIVSVRSMKSSNEYYLKLPR
jgi:hypothetical protein